MERAQLDALVLRVAPDLSDQVEIGPDTGAGELTPGPVRWRRMLPDLEYGSSERGERP
jgi:hypothetical protein